MRIGVHLRHWDRTPHDIAALAKLAEDVGLESVWVSETWGSDATVLATWIAAHTSTIAIGTGILQMPARTPAATAMAAATIDHVSGGRLRLGLGGRGPRGGRPRRSTMCPGAACGWVLASAARGSSRDGTAFRMAPL